MNAEEINKVQFDHNSICYAIQEAIRADKSLVVSEQWVAHLCADASAVSHFHVTGDTVVVNLQVYTQMTGGSYEFPEANIPLDTLNKYL